MDSERAGPEHEIQDGASIDVVCGFAVRAEEQQRARKNWIIAAPLPSLYF